MRYAIVIEKGQESYFTKTFAGSIKMIEPKHFLYSFFMASLLSSKFFQSAFIRVQKEIISFNILPLLTKQLSLYTLTA